MIGHGRSPRIRTLTNGFGDRHAAVTPDSYMEHRVRVELTNIDFADLRPTDEHPMHGGSAFIRYYAQLFHYIATVARDTNDAVSRLPGARGENRTLDTVIKSHVLFRLSYTRIKWWARLVSSQLPSWRSRFTVCRVCRFATDP